MRKDFHQCEVYAIDILMSGPAKYYRDIRLVNNKKNIQHQV